MLWSLLMLKVLLVFDACMKIIWWHYGLRDWYCFLWIIAIPICGKKHVTWSQEDVYWYDAATIAWWCLETLHIWSHIDDYIGLHDDDKDVHAVVYVVVIKCSCCRFLYGVWWLLMTIMVFLPHGGGFCVWLCLICLLM